LQQAAAALLALRDKKGTFRMPDGSHALHESAASVVVLDESRLGEVEQILRDFKSKTLD
jgi:hypothetical protein